MVGFWDIEAFALRRTRRRYSSGPHWRGRVFGARADSPARRQHDHHRRRRFVRAEDAGIGPRHRGADRRARSRTPRLERGLRPAAAGARAADGSRNHHVGRVDHQGRLWHVRDVARGTRRVLARRTDRQAAVAAAQHLRAVSRLGLPAGDRPAVAVSHAADAPRAHFRPFQLRDDGAGQEDAPSPPAWHAVSLLWRRDESRPVRDRAAKGPSARSADAGGVVHAARHDTHRHHLSDRVRRQRRRPLRRRREIRLADQAISGARRRVDDHQRRGPGAVCFRLVRRKDSEASDAQRDAPAVHSHPIPDPVCASRRTRRYRGRRGRPGLRCRMGVAHTHPLRAGLLQGRAR